MRVWQRQDVVVVVCFHASRLSDWLTLLDLPESDVGTVALRLHVGPEGELVIQSTLLKKGFRCANDFSRADSKQRKPPQLHTHTLAVWRSASNRDQHDLRVTHGDQRENFRHAQVGSLTAFHAHSHDQWEQRRRHRSGDDAIIVYDMIICDNSFATATIPSTNFCILLI